MANEGIEAEPPDSIKQGYKRVADLSVVKAWCSIILTEPSSSLSPFK